MRWKRELRFAIAVLLLIEIVTAFGAIGLLTRMTPAIETILEENEYSIEAAEEVLAVMALVGRDVAPAALEVRFDEAVRRARENVTEPDEEPLVRRMEETGRRALAGDTAAIPATVTAARRLIVVNRHAMRLVDEEAKRLGVAGAWAALFLAMAGFAASVVVARRLERRIIEPLAALYETIQAVRAGDPYRRCLVTDAPVEMTRLVRAINDLLDERFPQRKEGAPARRPERVVALRLLDRLDEPAVVVDETGAIVLANAEALARLGRSDGDRYRRALEAAAGGEPDPRLVRCTSLGEGLRLCTLVVESETAAPSG